VLKIAADITALVDRRRRGERLARDIDATLQGIRGAVGSASAEVAAATQGSTDVAAVATGAEELSASITEVRARMAEAANITTRAVTEAGATSETVGRLARATGEIEQIAQLITSIANQTNLLALNATIEAARAGEAGRSFAVVAGEVKALANQTGQATENVPRQISSWRRNRRLYERVHQRDAGGTEIRTIARRHRQPVHQRGGGDQRIPLGAGGRDMQRGATAGHRHVHRQDPPGEGRQYLPIDPAAQHRALGGILAGFQEHAEFHLQHRDRR
jgi:uncharacterized phage infection (PIP) family protein YhgE